MDGKVLFTGKDLRGNEVVIKHIESIGDTSVAYFFMKQFVDLYNLGWASPYFSASNFSRAVYAEINQRVVGHIVYNVLDKGIRTAWICLSAVDPDYRQCGIYKLMHTQFEAEAKRIGCGKIASFVHVDNLPRIKGCESVGMEPKFYKMEKDL